MAMTIKPRTEQDRKAAIEARRTETNAINKMRFDAIAKSPDRHRVADDAELRVLTEQMLDRYRGRRNKVLPQFVALLITRRDLLNAVALDWLKSFADARRSAKERD